MSSDEGQSVTEPRSKKFKDVRKNYFPAACIFLLLATALSVNTLLIYKYYRDMEYKAEFAYREIETMQLSQSEVLSENKYLKSENKTLIENYKAIVEQNREILKQMEEIKKRNEELSKLNKELTDDNIALQNSLKKAASVGIKPQNFTTFNGITSRGDVQKGKYLGKFLGTAYTPSAEECGNNKGITNSGHPIIPGISVAIDKNYWPFGTVFYIKGLGYAVAMDTGSAIKGKNRFDFAVFDKEFAKTLGTKYWEVYLVKLGNGKVGSVSF